MLLLNTWQCGCGMGSDRFMQSVKQRRSIGFALPEGGRARFSGSRPQFAGAKCIRSAMRNTRNQVLRSSGSSEVLSVSSCAYTLRLYLTLSVCSALHLMVGCADLLDCLPVHDAGEEAK